MGNGVEIGMVSPEPGVEIGMVSPEPVPHGVPRTMVSPEPAPVRSLGASAKVSGWFRVLLPLQVP
jgi:hypothetical protein